jgi:hypothetical protein
MSFRGSLKIVVVTRTSRSDFRNKLVLVDERITFHLAFDGNGIKHDLQHLEGRDLLVAICFCNKEVFDR